MSRTYHPTVDLSHSPTIQQALMDTESTVRIVVGPVGSGKSYTFGSTEMMRLALSQHIFPGTRVRRARQAIIRNTTPELKSTTIKTWTELWDEQACGPVVYSSPITHRVRVGERPDQPGIDAEFMFLGLDKPKDISRAKSLEVNAIWANECSELPRELFMYLRRRIGRFPPKREGIEAVQPCLIGDSNAVDEDHWLARLYKDPPQGFGLYKQPPAVLEVEKHRGKAVCIEPDPRYKGMKFDLAVTISAAGRLWVVNPHAENLANLRERYYEDNLTASTLAEIQRDLQAKWVYVQDGRPVIPDYQDDVHSFEELPVLKDVPLRLGLDVGGGTLNPAAVIAQRAARGNYLTHDEVADYMGVDALADLLASKLVELQQQGAGGIEIGWGDPAGAKGDEIYETAIFEHLRRKGIPVQPAPSNQPKMRIEAITGVAQRFIDGKPMLMIHKRCRGLRKALSGGWYYKRVQVSGEERYQEEPNKNHPDSDLGDALGYLVLGDGEHRQMTGRKGVQADTQQAAVDFDVFAI